MSDHELQLKAVALRRAAAGLAFQPEGLMKYSPGLRAAPPWVCVPKDSLHPEGVQEPFAASVTLGHFRSHNLSGPFRQPNAPILGSILGVENTYGALDGRTPAGPLTYGRITTADAEGKIRCYVGEGELTNDELKTFGNRAVAKVPNLQKVLRHVCEKGFEHHVVMTQSHSAEILAEAFGNYFGWEVYNHDERSK